LRLAAVIRKTKHRGLMQWSQIVASKETIKTKSKQSTMPFQVRECRTSQDAYKYEPNDKNNNLSMPKYSNLPKPE
jgi:hypothetical protein